MMNTYNDYTSAPLGLKLFPTQGKNGSYQINVVSDRMLLSYSLHNNNSYILRAGSKNLSLINLSKAFNGTHHLYLNNPNAQWTNIEIKPEQNEKGLNKLFILADEIDCLNMISFYWKRNATNSEWWLMTDKENCIAKVAMEQGKNDSYFNLYLTLGLSRDTLLLILSSSCILTQLVFNNKPF